MAKHVWKLASERKPNGVIGDDTELMAEVVGLKAKLSRKL